MRSPARLALAALVALFAACGSGRHAPPLRIGVPYELTTLGPHAQNSVSHFAVHSHLYDALVKMNADMAIEPGLAQTWQSPDARTWVFRLRSDVLFHSGRPLRPADVVHSIETLRRRPDLEMGTYLADVSAVSALDAGSVQLTTVRPARNYVQMLGFDVWRQVTPFCSAQPNPFRDGRVRCALDLAIDRALLAGQLPSPAAPMHQLVPRFIFGFDRGCQTGDAGDLVENLVHSPNPDRHLGLYNWGRFADPAERRSALQAMLGSVADQHVLLPLYVDQEGYAADERLDFRPRADGLIRASEIGYRRR